MECSRHLLKESQDLVLISLSGLVYLRKLTHCRFVLSGLWDLWVSGFWVQGCGASGFRGFGEGNCKCRDEVVLVVWWDFPDILGG